MIIESILIKEGVFKRSEQFSPHANLIHSRENSVGKTTFLRFILYSLGFNIPNTRGIKFERCEVTTTILSDIGERIKLTRSNATVLLMERGSVSTTFVLPSQQKELHALLFNTQNEDLLNNILGCIYADQEKGWTLLNRGVAIGSVHFNIEELLRGLSGKDCKSLITERDRTKRELEKYKQMSSIAQYQDAVISGEGSLVRDSYEDTVNVETESLLIRQKELRKELTRIDAAIKDNGLFRKYIANMKLQIRLPSGDIMLVTEDCFVGLLDTVEYLAAKRNIVAYELQKIADSLARIQSESQKETEQLSFIESKDVAEVFDRNLSSIPINAVAIAQKIRQLETHLRELNDAISEKTRSNNDAAASMYKTIVRYATELGIGDETTISAGYLFTSNLKELSGATLHKTVFAFRLAYLLEVQKLLGIRLPIILDSPRGKEVDEKNIQKMIEILKRDFSENQIIIASIFDYAFDEIHRIEINQRLIVTPQENEN